MGLSPIEVPRSFSICSPMEGTARVTIVARCLLVPVHGVQVSANLARRSDPVSSHRVSIGHCLMRFGESVRGVGAFGVVPLPSAAHGSEHGSGTVGIDASPNADTDFTIANSTINSAITATTAA
jgi:hypothetical protein